MKIISTLDCGCAIREDGSRAWCPTCADGGRIRTTISFQELRTANMLRVGQFRNRHGEIAHPTGVAHWSLTEWCLAAFGELGETANLIKKLNRGELLPTDTALQDEIADTVIYLDLLASRAGFDLGAAIRAKFNRKSQEIGVNVFL